MELLWIGERGVFLRIRAITGFGKGAISRRRLPYTQRVRIRAGCGQQRSVASLCGARPGGRSSRRTRAPLAVERGYSRRPRLGRHTGFTRSGGVSPFCQLEPCGREWLRCLGCRVNGNTLTSRFTVITESDVSVRQAPQRRDGATPLSPGRESSRPYRKSGPERAMVQSPGGW